ncbi:MAG: glycosyltransferase [Treponema sp.]|jgi:glycosyltransferase involved in cell wall biosynthesis|nr:glycosyltransferase [Treponema sp.]
MNTTPLFSILLANYNNSSFLDDCLGSIYKQSYKNWEVIFIDDCSNDDSLGVINNYASKDNRIIVFVNETNKGCGFTKARCIQLASGEICGFLDTDDALMPNALEIMVQKHTAHPDTAIVYSRRYHCSKNLKIRDISPDNTGKFVSQLATPLINHFASFKKKMYDQTTGIDTYMKRAVDQDLYLKLEEKGAVIFIPEILYLYRHNINSISLSNNEYKAQAWHIYANSNACKRRNLSLDDYCTIIKPGKFMGLMLKLLAVIHWLQHKIKRILHLGKK